MASRTHHVRCRLLAGVTALGFALAIATGLGQGLGKAKASPKASESGPSPGRYQGLGPLKGFKAVMENHDPPHETQAKTLLEGATGRQLTASQWLLSDVTLQTFSEIGAREILIHAPQCVYDSTRRTAGSPGPLHVQTGDGKFSIEGEGFLWSQTNASLIISNRVHTVIQPDALQSASSQPRPQASAPETENIDIFSDQFQYIRRTAESASGIYEGNVRVAGTNLALVGGVLTVEVPMRENRETTGLTDQNRLRRITAEKNVVIDYRLDDGTDIHATGDRAVYSADTGVVRISGHPTWQAGQREGRGDELTIDRTNKVFMADGQAWLRMHGQSLGGSLAFPGYGTNDPASPPTTNQFVEIVSRNYEIRTNWAIFRDHVQVSDLRDDKVQSTMNCRLMTVTFTGTNELERLVAETNVAIQQDDPKEPRRLTGGKAVYTGAGGVLELTQNPAWQVGPREGRGEVIVIHVKTNEMVVRTNASMRLPAAEFATAAMSGSGITNKTSSKIATNEFAQIYSSDYVLQPEDILFRGGVYASHPQMNWSCETLTAHRSPGGQIDRLEAEQRVKFDLRNEKGQTVHGAGDRAVYAYDVTDSVTNDVLRLTGNPATMTTTNGLVVNSVIVWDRANNTVSTPGKYSIHIKAGNTNAFRLPKNKLFGR